MDSQDREQWEGEEQRPEGECSDIEEFHPLIIGPEEGSSEHGGADGGYQHDPVDPYPSSLHVRTLEYLYLVLARGPVECRYVLLGAQLFSHTLEIIFEGLHDRRDEKCQGLIAHLDIVDGKVSPHCRLDDLNLLNIA